MWPIKQIKQWFRKPQILLCEGIWGSMAELTLTIQDPQGVDVIVKGRAESIALGWGNYATAELVVLGGRGTRRCDFDLSRSPAALKGLAGEGTVDGGDGELNLTGDFDSDNPMQAESKP